MGRLAGSRLSGDTQMPRLALPLLVTVLAVVVWCYDLSFFEYGEYRQPTFDSAHYFEKADYLLMLAGNQLPWLTEFLNVPAFARSPHITEGDYGLVVRYLSGQGPGYPVFLSLVELTLGWDDPSGRLAQAITHLLCLLLVVAIARRLAGRGAAMVAALLFAAYVPVAYMASQFLAGNLCLLLVLLSVYLALRWLPVDSGRPTLVAAGLGLALAWLALSRPVYVHFAWVFALLCAGLFLWNHRGRPLLRRLLPVVVLLVAMLAPYLSWQFQVTRAYDSERFIWSISQIRSVAPSLWESYDLNNDGWVKPSGFLGPRGRNQWVVPITQSLREQPLQSAGLRVEKLYRLWRAPATAYNNPYGMSASLTNGLHVVLVAGGLLGLLLLRRPQGWWVVALPIMFTTAAYTAYFTEERRFVFPVMGLVIVFCAIAITQLWQRYRQAGFIAYGQRLSRSSRWALGGVLLCGYGLRQPGAVLVPWLDVGWVHGLVVAAFGLAFGWLAWRMAVWIAAPGWRRLWVASVLGVVLLLPPLLHQVSYHDWRAWSVTLDQPGEQVSQRFTLPDGLSWGQIVAATVQIDVQDGDGRLDGLEITLNDTPLTDPVTPARMPSQLLFAAENLAPLSRGVDFTRVAVVPGMRQWLTYPLDPARLAGNRSLTLRVTVVSEQDDAQATRLFGELSSRDPAAYTGPRPWLSPALNRDKVRWSVYSGRNSLWRYQAYGDMRLYGDTSLLGHVESGYRVVSGQPVVAGDLSDSRWAQPGSYRIRLQLITASGQELIL